MLALLFEAAVLGVVDDLLSEDELLEEALSEDELLEDELLEEALSEDELLEALSEDELALASLAVESEEEPSEEPAGLSSFLVDE